MGPVLETVTGRAGPRWSRDTRGEAEEILNFCMGSRSQRQEEMLARSEERRAPLAASSACRARSSSARYPRQPRTRRKNQLHRCTLAFWARPPLGSRSAAKKAWLWSRFSGLSVCLAHILRCAVVQYCLNVVSDEVKSLGWRPNFAPKVRPQKMAPQVWQVLTWKMS
jgi:hypothetical protein